MALFRNDFGEDRVLPTLDWHMVPAGQTFTVPDDQIEHWAAAGFTPADPATVKAVEAADAERAAAHAAASATEATAPPASVVETPAAAPAKTTKVATPAPTEGGES